MCLLTNRLLVTAFRKRENPEGENAVRKGLSWKPFSAFEQFRQFANCKITNCNANFNTSTLITKLQFESDFVNDAQGPIIRMLGTFKNSNWGTVWNPKFGTVWGCHTFRKVFWDHPEAPNRTCQLAPGTRTWSLNLEFFRMEFLNRVLNGRTSLGSSEFALRPSNWEWHC